MILVDLPIVIIIITKFIKGGVFHNIGFDGGGRTTIYYYLIDEKKGQLLNLESDTLSNNLKNNYKDLQQRFAQYKNTSSDSGNKVEDKNSNKYCLNYF